jgi:hypothetical protein
VGAEVGGRSKKLEWEQRLGAGARRWGGSREWGSELGWKAGRSGEKPAGWEQMLGAGARSWSKGWEREQGGGVEAKDGVHEQRSFAKAVGKRFLGDKIMAEREHGTERKLGKEIAGEC